MTLACPSISLVRPIILSYYQIKFQCINCMYTSIFIYRPLFASLQFTVFILYRSFRKLLETLICQYFFNFFWRHWILFLHILIYPKFQILILPNTSTEWGCSFPDNQVFLVYSLMQKMLRSPILNPSLHRKMIFLSWITSGLQESTSISDKFTEWFVVQRKEKVILWGGCIHLAAHSIFPWRAITHVHCSMLEMYVHYESKH